MIAIDTSSLSAYLSGVDGGDLQVVDVAFVDKTAVLPAVVVSEILSDPQLPESVVGLLLELPRLHVDQGYWERAGRLRARVLGRGNKARLADALVAQSCLDHDVPLVTRDRDFRHFATVAGLKLLP